MEVDLVLTLLELFPLLFELEPALFELLLELGDRGVLGLDRVGEVDRLLGEFDAGGLERFLLGGELLLTQTQVDLDLFRGPLGLVQLPPFGVEGFTLLLQGLAVVVDLLAGLVELGPGLVERPRRPACARPARARAARARRSGRRAAAARP